MTGKAFSSHIKVVIGESVIASSAATLSVLAFEIPVWAMFVGWISFFTRGLNLQQGIINVACVLIGVMLGIAAAHGLAALTPYLDTYAISAVVFAITIIALSLAKAPAVNNLPAIFLGLVAYFALHQPPSMATFGTLTLATTLGAIAAFLAHSLQNHIRHNATHSPAGEPKWHAAKTK